jgi:hypothetical protein
MKAKYNDSSYRKAQRDGSASSWTQERRKNQSKLSKGLWLDDNFRGRLVDSVTDAWKDSDRRGLASKRSIDQWKDEQYRSNHKKAVGDEHVRVALSEKVRSMWQRSEYVSKQSLVKKSLEYTELQRQLAISRFSNSEYRQQILDSLQEHWEDPEIRQMASDRAKSLWDDPVYRERQIQASLDLGLRTLKSDNAKLQWQKSESRQAIIDGIKRKWEDLEYKKQASNISKRRWADDEYKKKQAIGRAGILSNGKDSILERTVQIMLDALQIPYTRHHLVGYFEFDLFIPSHDVLIECNGEYWHSLRKDRDAAKFNYVDTYFPSYKILYLWERDFLNPNLIRQKLIRALFGTRDTEPERQIEFSMSDLSVRHLDLSTIPDNSYYNNAEEFLQAFHYAGYGRSAKTVYGVFLEDKLIGVCKFASPIRNEVATSMGLSQSQVLELDRFCIHPSYQKKNLASWFISRCAKLAFTQYPKVLSLVSFADSTFGHVGTIYRAANWKQVHVVPPDYHYLSPEGFVVHKKTLYDHASRNGCKEAEYADKFGYVKSFGKSKIKFRLDR